jgi:hypothetical protein
MIALATPRQWRGRGLTRAAADVEGEAEAHLALGGWRVLRRGQHVFRHPPACFAEQTCVEAQWNRRAGAVAPDVVHDVDARAVAAGETDSREDVGRERAAEDRRAATESAEEEHGIGVGAPGPHAAGGGRSAAVGCRGSFGILDGDVSATAERETSGAAEREGHPDEGILRGAGDVRRERADGDGRLSHGYRDRCQGECDCRDEKMTLRAGHNASG